MTSKTEWDRNLAKALALADKREAICKHSPLCPSCSSEQVQLVTWIDTVGWKCRVCKLRFYGAVTYE